MMCRNGSLLPVPHDDGPRADRGGVLKEWKNEPQSLLERLPLNYDDTTLATIEQIDVLWLKGRAIQRAFEVEHSTAIYSGLLRMADLATLSPNLSFPLYVVAPASRLPRVRRELMRPAFRALALDRRCRFFSSEALLKALPSLARWATGPDAIEKLAEMVTID